MIRRTALASLAALALLGACAGPAEAPATVAPSPSTSSPSIVAQEPTHEPTTALPASACVVMPLAEERVAFALDGAAPVAGSGVYFKEGDGAYFLGVELEGEGIPAGTVAVFATPDLEAGPVLPASSMARSFAPDVATAEDVWGVAPVGGSVDVVEGCFE